MLSTVYNIILCVRVHNTLATAAAINTLHHSHGPKRLVPGMYKGNDRIRRRGLTWRNGEKGQGELSSRHRPNRCCSKTLWYNKKRFLVKVRILTVTVILYSIGTQYPRDNFTKTRLKLKYYVFLLLF